MTGPGRPVPGTFDPLPFFPGPRGENTATLKALLIRLVDQNTAWRASFPAGGPALAGEATTALDAVVADLSARLSQTFPFHGPHYLAHQQNDTQLASLLGVIAGTLYNANNVTVESGLSTVELELIACDRVMRMLGYRPPQDPATATDPADLGRPAGALPDSARQSEVSGWFGWAHLSSGGTTANMEALWIARVVRFMPLSIRAAANTQECAGIYLPIQLTLDDDEVDIRSADPVQLLRLRPRGSAK